MRQLFLLTVIATTTSVATAQIDPDLDTLLQHKTDSMHTLLNNHSLSAAISFSDGNSWEYANGNSGLFEPAVPGQVYLIGSITKTMIAACILQLADEQILSLDDSIHDWLPPMNNINPDISLRQLLRHQSGLYDVLTNPQTQPALLANQDSVWNAGDLIETFIQPPLANPGVNWNYCNTNYFLLGMIIESATGNPFYSELRNRFFTPLNLPTIAIPSFEQQTSPVCHVWMDLNGDNSVEDGHAFYYNWLSLNSAGGAAGGYYATAADVSDWMRTYQRGDLLSSTMMAEAHTMVLAPGLPSTTYGLGLMKRSFLGYEAYGHGGDLAYSATSWYFPALDISISVLNNDSRITSWELAPVIAALLEGYLSWQQADVVEIAQQEPQAFPNPFNDELNIVLPKSLNNQILSGSLFSVDGKKVAESMNNHFAQHDLEVLTSGTYFLQLTTDQQLTFTQKVIRQ